jgi:hypothetical protein
VANLIDMENGIVVCCNKSRKSSKQRAAALQSELLAYRSAFERNKAAAEALELFYLLAEVEHDRDALAQSLSEIDTIRDYMARIRASGLDLDIAESAVYNRRAELLDQKAKLALDRSRLNSELRRRLGFDVDDQTPIWPETDLKVEVAQIDVDTAIAEGLAMRPDLAAIQRLAECLDTNSLAHACTSLRAVDAMLGSASRKFCLVPFLDKAEKNCEWSNRWEQLHQMLVHQQRAVAEEIRQTVRAVEARLEQIAIAKQRLDNRQKGLADLKLQWGGEDVTAFQISDARLKVIEARTDLVHQVIAWEIACVKLKQAQGLFALACGYTEAGGSTGYLPADQEAPASEIDSETSGDVTPPPAPPFAEEEPANLRHPASVTGSDPASNPDAPEVATDAEDRPPQQLPQPGGLLPPPRSPQLSPQGRTATDGLDAQTPEPSTDGDAAPPLEEPAAPAPASPSSPHAGSLSANDFEQDPAAASAPNNGSPTADESTGQSDAATSHQQIEPQLPPDMVFGEKLSALPRRAAPEMTTGRASKRSTATPQRAAAVLEQPKSLTTGRTQPGKTEHVESGNGEKDGLVSRAAAPGPEAETPPLTAAGLRQPESVASLGAQLRATHGSQGGRDGSGLIVSPAEVANGNQPGVPTERITLRQPESVGTAEVANHLTTQATASILKQPISFASVPSQPDVATAIVHHSCNACESATSPGQCSCECTMRTRCVRPVSRPPRFVSNAQRHVQPACLSGGCRSRCCEQVQGEQGH